MEREIIDKREDFQSWPELKQNAWIEHFGAFLGVCLIKNFGGEWIKHEGTVGVRLHGSDFLADTFNKVWKQFQADGAYHSATSFYEITPTIDNITKRNKGE